MKQSIFDKELRRTERHYHRELADKIEEFNSSDPKQFWEQIKKLGPQSGKSIPEKVYTENGELSDDIYFVKSQWKSEFETLYNKPESDNVLYDDSFYNHILSKKEI